MPVLFGDLVEDYEAFLDLHQTRQAGFSTNPVGFGEIIAWMDVHGVDDPQRRRLMTSRIRVLDRAFLEFEKNGSTEDGPGKKPNETDPKKGTRR